MFDVERVIIKSEDDPVNKYITTRISRFAAGMELDKDKDDKVFLIEHEFPIVITRYAPSKVESADKVFLITEEEKKKSGTRIYYAPGTLCGGMAFDKKISGVELDEAIMLFVNFFAERIEGCTVDKNDILINNKKVFGINITNNEATNRMMIYFIITMKAEHINKMVREDDFFDKKYEGITGICDETKMTEDDVRAIVNEFIYLVEGWRTE